VHVMEHNPNPLIRTLRLPGETVALPSRGLFYKNNEVSPEVVLSGEIYVQPMTTYEEILMKTPDMLFTGQSIVQTFARCIPQIYDPLELLAADVDFLLIALRKISLGANISITYTHNCENAKQYEYNVDINKFIKETKYVDPTSIVSSFSHTLPNGQEVNLRPFRFKDILEISQVAVNEPIGDNVSELDTAAFMLKLLVAGTRPAILNVIAEGEVIENPAFIEEWVRALPVLWLKELARVIEKANKWGTNPSAAIICKDCQKPLDVQIPLNPQNFFTLPSDLETLN
jgi:hypothetical protein